MLAFSDNRSAEPCNSSCLPLDLPLHRRGSGRAEEVIRAYRIDSSSAGDVHTLVTSELPPALLASPLTSGLLQDEEITALQRYRFASDRERVFASMILRRCVLSLYDSRPPEAWRLVRSPQGEPEIAPQSLDERVTRLTFSVSRSDLVSVCGAPRSGPVEVDIESTASQLHPNFAAAVLHPSELADWEPDVPSRVQPFELLRYWTLKEALLKATGEELLCDVKQIALAGVGTSHIRLVRSARRSAKERQFSREHISDKYVVSRAYGACGSA